MSASGYWLQKFRLLVKCRRWLEQICTGKLQQYKRCSWPSSPNNLDTIVSSCNSPTVALRGFLRCFDFAHACYEVEQYRFGRLQKFYARVPGIMSPLWPMLSVSRCSNRTGGASIVYLVSDLPQMQSPDAVVDVPHAAIGKRPRQLDHLFTVY